jgi:hypothetical protein
MALPETLKEAVDKFRTDPAGFTYVGLGLGLSYLAERRDLVGSASTITSLASVGLVAGGVVHLTNMFEYARRTEESLQDVGFNDTRLMTTAYCRRQAGKIACEKSGYAVPYLALCEKRRDEGKLRYGFLPHI